MAGRLECQNCGSTDIGEDGGQFICRDCHQVFEGLQHIDYSEFGVATTTNKKKIASKTSKPAEVKPNQKKRPQREAAMEMTGLGNTVDQLYHMGILLTTICDALINQYNCPAILKKIVVHSWVTFLKGENIAFCGPNASTDSKAKDYYCPALEKSMPKPSSEVMLKIYDLPIRLSTAVSFVYLGLLQCRVTHVLISDLRRILILGKIPIAKENLIPFQHEYGSVVSCNFGLTPSSVWVECLKLGVYMDTFKPPYDRTYNFCALCKDLLRRMNLPESLLHKMHHLVMRHPPTCYFNSNSLDDVMSELDKRPWNSVHALHSELEQRVVQFGFALETKCIGYLLLALKLTYGLDDRREFEFTKSAIHYNEQENGDEERVFPIVEWLIQSEMRLATLSGDSIQRVLSMDWYDRNQLTTNQIGKGNVFRDNTDTNFHVHSFWSLCKPSGSISYTEEHVLSSAISEEEETVRPFDAQEHLSPLQYQAVKHAEAARRIEDIDAQSYKIFFQDYRSYCLHLNEKDSQDNSNNFPDLFPCASKYEKTEVTHKTFQAPEDTAMFRIRDVAPSTLLRIMNVFSGVLGEHPTNFYRSLGALEHFIFNMEDSRAAIALDPTIGGLGKLSENFIDSIRLEW